jgi:hypothetical protein
MVMVIESGAVYSVSSICLIAMYAAKNNVQYIILDFVRSDISVSRFLVLNYSLSFILQQTSLIVRPLAYLANVDIPTELCTPGDRLYLNNCPGWTRSQLKREQPPGPIAESIYFYCNNEVPRRKQ